METQEKYCKKITFNYGNFLHILKFWPPMDYLSSIIRTLHKTLNLILIIFFQVFVFFRIQKKYNTQTHKTQKLQKVIKKIIFFFLSVIIYL